MAMSLEGQVFGISNLNLMTTDIPLIDIVVHDKEIEERTHKYLYKPF